MEIDGNHLNQMGVNMEIDLNHLNQMGGAAGDWWEPPKPNAGSKCTEIDGNNLNKLGM